MNVIKRELKSIRDHRGALVSLEVLREIPFEVKRIYYLTELDPNYPRGFHAHKDLKQFVICLAGSCRFLLDDGYSRSEVLLSTPYEALIIENNIWREMHDFSHNCILIVFASQFYDEADYIRDYDEFKKLYSPEK